jgi:NitT/TauT family transport system substrate-binding protein
VLTDETKARWLRAVAFAAAGLLVVAALALGYAGRLGPTPRYAAPVQKLRIALPLVPHAALLHIAAAKGYFTEEGLDVTLALTSHGKAALDLVTQGQADLAAAAEVPFVISVLKGEPLAIVATVVSVSNVAEVVARRDRGARRSASPSAPAATIRCGRF